MAALLKSFPLWVGGFGLLFGLGVHLRLGPACQLVADFTGHKVWVDPMVLDVGVCGSGARISDSVIVRNFWDYPVEVVGSQVSCTCTVTSGLPLTIGNSKSGRIPLEIQLPAAKTPRRFEERVILLVSERGALKRLEVRICGQIDPASER